jgi:hypothetical protein
VEKAHWIYYSQTEFSMLSHEVTHCWKWVL